MFLARCADGFEGFHHELWVGATESVNGLLGVAYPDDFFHVFGKLHEDGELKRAGVLELVNYQNFVLVFDGLTYLV